MATINQKKAAEILKELKLSKEDKNIVLAVLNKYQKEYDNKVSKKSKNAITKLEKAKSEYKESLKKAEDDSLVELITKIINIKSLNIEVKKDEEVEKPSIESRLNLSSSNSQNVESHNRDFNQYQNRY